MRLPCAPLKPEPAFEFESEREGALYSAQTTLKRNTSRKEFVSMKGSFFHSLKHSPADSSFKFFREGSMKLQEWTLRRHIQTRLTIFDDLPLFELLKHARFTHVPVGARGRGAGSPALQDYNVLRLLHFSEIQKIKILCLE
ncbi:hypothetical protein SISSUDRAFT_1064915 [Sistotremastrum suecicum HHB10207 ss-3]|uniref:Uncharacterized protein n=1 Tax=Sistotremastrum suecicum HHB10207 ss-3 TaxID=1314776 RepID=A0A166A3E2_9AGAM|nr:hypothetical protein SISSUDRAFT_1064915 [Sistotremastrum suecicum HHB10207 ss-3]